MNDQSSRCHDMIDFIGRRSGNVRQGLFIHSTNIMNRFLVCHLQSSRDNHKAKVSPYLAHPHDVGNPQDLDHSSHPPYCLSHATRAARSRGTSVDSHTR